MSARRLPAAHNHPLQVARRGANDGVDDRETPPELFADLDARFRFTVDAAAAEHNAKLPRYWTRADSGLAQPWALERVWCNPPYSDIARWVSKAWAESELADVIVMLLPANRTEQPWWQADVEPYRDRPGHGLRCEFLPGRPRFSRASGMFKSDRPPFGLCLLIWQSVRSDITRTNYAR